MSILQGFVEMGQDSRVNLSALGFAVIPRGKGMAGESVFIEIAIAIEIGECRASSRDNLIFLEMFSISITISISMPIQTTGGERVQVRPGKGLAGDLPWGRGMGICPAHYE
ncbi:MAG: hypothetical protein EA399_01680 [Desulfovibrionales bacterium]|nr:MAG: hypothetical protein EA399_01680 [Desulfovibrionales bacterium]